MQSATGRRGGGPRDRQGPPGLAASLRSGYDSVFSSFRIALLKANEIHKMSKQPKR